jgi:hypothetical protein
VHPYADGLKPMIKEPTLPSPENIVRFLLAQVLTFLLGLLAWKGLLNPINN